ncbi:hypothetical protein G6F68_011582 [Rhizopus microsporus]|nr:hypothetical protein G6F68_011582 [Rhizopus microsporus]
MICVGEKLSVVYLGSLVGGGIEIWFAYVLALLFLLFHQLPGRPADLPDPPGPHLHLAAAGRGVHRRAGAVVRLPAARHPDPVPDPVAGRRGREHPGRVLRADLAGHRRLHGGGRLCSLELRRALSRHAAGHPDPAGRLLRHDRGRDLRHPQPAHPGPVPGCGHAGRAVLRGLGVPAHPVLHQLLIVGQRVGAAADGLRPARAERAGKVPVRADPGGDLQPAGQEPGARRHRPPVDGDPRHGRGRLRHRHPAHVRQAHRVRRQFVHRRRGRRLVGLHPPGCCSW